MIVAGICITFSSVSFLTWGIDYAMNYKNFSLKEASLSLAIVALLSSVLGVLSGGFFADRLQRRLKYGRILAISCSFLVATPFLLFALQSDEKWMVLSGFFVSACISCRGITDQPRRCCTISRRSAPTPPPSASTCSPRSSSGALGPLLIGRISDISDLQIGLQAATAVMVFGALLLLLVIHFVRRDGLHHPRLAAFRAEDEAAH